MKEAKEAIAITISVIVLGLGAGAISYSLKILICDPAPVVSQDVTAQE